MHTQSPARGFSFGMLLLVLVGLAITGYAVYRVAGGGRVQLAGGKELSGNTKEHPPAFLPASTIDEAVAASATSGKPVLLLFTAEWCGPCQGLKQGALSDPGFAKLVQSSTHAVLVDCTASMPAIGSQLGVKGYPTLMLIKNGKELARIAGGRDAASLSRWLAEHGG